ncbi:O-antigen ligase family protein [Thiorhodovibrio litoralis]|uniref:O-antigen ligase family protein n=1 Tax=Thiorhodovibrio litoralis TaxID=2952932 RepID=UPI002B260B4E|nr:O-antigen ligase family protein [Thiorhodovibrio litoralis]
MLLLKLFITAEAAYAAYGLIVYFAELDTILWFDKEAYRGLLTATFVNRNSYATYAGLGTMAALALVLRYLRHMLTTDADQRSRLRDFIETLTSSGWLLAVAVLLCFLALLLTESRMGLMAFLAGVTVLMLGWSLRLPAGRTRKIGLALMTLPLVLLVLNLSLSGDQTVARFASLFEQGDQRFDVYPLMQEAIAERPLLGYGLGSFESAFRLVRDENISVLFRRGHSDYLELVMEIGWPATLVLLSAFLLMLASALKLYLSRTDFELALLFIAATVQIGVHALVDFSMQMPAVVFAYLFLAGAAFGASRRRTPS